MHRQVLIDPINRNQYKMCSYSYVLLHTIIIFVRAKSHILQCAYCCQAPFHIFQDIMTFYILAISIKLGMWSCRLWYQHPSRLLTLWTKQDSGLLRGIFDYRLRGTDRGGEE